MPYLVVKTSYVGPPYIYGPYDDYDAAEFAAENLRGTNTGDVSTTTLLARHYLHREVELRTSTT